MELNEENFYQYAVDHYDNPSCSGLDEFNNDLKRFRYLKRLFRKQSNGESDKERLILNHIVILSNLFGSEACSKMLFYKIEEQYWSQLKSYLLFLNLMPEVLHLPMGVLLYREEINTDIELEEKLTRL